MHTGAEYSAESADVWSIGVIIFALRFGRYPFEAALESDYTYKLLADGNYATFWAEVNRNNELELSTNFKSLLESLFCPELNRFSMKDLKKHPWI